MAKPFWLALAVTLALVAGLAAAMVGPELGSPLVVAPPDAPGLVRGAVAALLVLFVTVFAGSALRDALTLRRTRGRLDQLLADVRAGQPVDPDDFIAACGPGLLAEPARSYAFSLHRDAPGGRHLGADPRSFFPVDGLIGDRLYMTLFRRLPGLLVLLGAGALAWALRGVLPGSVLPDARVTSGEGPALVVAAGLALGLAVLVGLIVSATGALLRRRLAGLVGRIAALFQGADEPVYVRRLLEAQNLGAADLRRSVGVALSEIRRLFECLRRRIEDQPADGAGDGSAVAAALERALPAVVGELGRTLARLAEEQQATLSQAVQAGVAAGTAAALERIEQGLAALPRGGGDGLATGGDRLGLELTLDRLVDRLGRLAERLDGLASDRAETGDPAVLARLETIGAGLSAQGETLQRLYASVDSLCLSVAPVVSRLADTQEDLLAAVTGESTTARLLVDLADDLRQLARGNRETIERHVQLAGELARVAEGLQARAEAARPRGLPIEPDPLLADALRQLQREADEAARSLPALHPAA